MQFKTTVLATGYMGAHPRLRRALTEFDEQLAAWKLPELMVTDVLRTHEENVDIYRKFYRKQGHTVADADRLAKARFSWHMVGCAADFRSSKEPYAIPDAVRITRWLRSKHPSPMWEVLKHSVGLGEHWHLAFCEYAKRREYEQNLGTA